MDSHVLTVVCGVVLFLVGFKALSWSSTNTTDNVLEEAYTSSYRYDTEPASGSYFALILGLSLLCAGSIMVGGTFFGWSADRTFSELWNVCGNILQFL